MAGSEDVLVLQQPGLITDEGKDAGKKKRFTLKNFKQLFTRKKRSKMKDESGEETPPDIKSRSITNIHAAPQEDGSRGVGSSTMSVSHDSVFTGERVAEVPTKQVLKSQAISMDRLAGNVFASELDSALRRRRGNSEDEDEALPESPYPYPNTTQAVIENGLKSNPKKSKSYDSQSDHSLMSLDSSDNDLDVDFFHEKWASSGSLSKGTSSPDPGSGGSDLDLDVITASHTSLNTSAAKHRISVKQKAKRPASHISGKNRRRANSPRPMTTMQVMPEEQEESKSAKLKPNMSENTLEILGSSPSTKMSRSPRTKVKFEEPKPDYDEESNKPNVDIIVADSSAMPSAPKPIKSIISSKPAVKPEELNKPLKPVQSPPATAASKQDEPTSPFKNVVLRKTSREKPPPAELLIHKEEEKIETKIVETKSTETTVIKSENEKPAVILRKKETTVTKVTVEEKVVPEVKSPALDVVKSEDRGSGYDNVVMRPKSTATQDASKRQTIASSSGSETEMTIFGEKKLKRASLVEPRDWENLDNPKSETISSSETSPNNEFSQMFSKFQRRASQKRDEPPKVKTVDIEVDKACKRDSKESSEIKSPSSSSKPIIIAKAHSDNTKKEQSVAPATKPAVATSKPSSLPTKPLVISAKPGSVKAASGSSEVPSDSSVKSGSATAGPDSSAVKAAASKSEEKPSGFNLKQVSARPHSIAFGAKHKENAQLSLENDKSVEKDDKHNEKESKNETVHKKTERKSLHDPLPKKTLVIEEKTKVQTVTAQPSNNSGKERNVTVVINKSETTTTTTKTEKDENTKPSSQPYKRPSPLQKDRFRSQTLPEHQTGSPKEVLQTKTDNKADSKTNSPNLPQRSKSMKPISSSQTKPPVKKIEITEKTPPVKKIEIKEKTVTIETKKPESNNSAPPAKTGNNQPEWMKLAQKKTGGFNNQKEVSPEPVKDKPATPSPAKETTNEDEEKTPSIQDLMKRFQKR